MMPKLKTHRGAAKRFAITATGKIKRRKAFASHILTTKTRKRKRNLRKVAYLHETNAKAIKKILPYHL